MQLTRLSFLFFTAMAGLFGQQFSAATGNPLATGTAPYASVTGDFNRDGYPDFAAANSSVDSISIWLGNGSGGFTAVSATPATGVAPYGMTAGDFNNDGKLDLATANYGSQSVSVLLGNGAGGFSAAPGSPFATGTGPYAVVAGDFNGDGKLDLATANGTNNNVTILLGNGAGSFTQASGSPVSVGAGPQVIAVGDFDRNGKPDLAVGNSSSNTVSILLGSGTGTFSASTVTVLSKPYGMAVGDFNHDGKPDFATSHPVLNVVVVMLGNGSGGFSSATDSPINVGAGPFSMVAADFNGDGEVDLATSNFQSNSLTFLPGNGTGHFSGSGISQFAVGPFPIGLSVADFNGDGKPDLVVPASTTSRVEVYLNSTPSLSTKPAALTFYSGLGRTAPVGIPVAVASSVSGSTYSVGVNQSWLTASPTTAATGGVTSVALSANQTGLAAGTYAGIARYTAPGFFGSKTDVTLRVAQGSGRLRTSPFGFPGVGAGPYAIATGDFNGDGKPDFATANLEGNTVSVWLGATLASMTNAPGSPFAVGSGPVSVVVGDFNGDGRQDLATANFYGGTVSVLLGNGSGGFSAAFGSPFAVGTTVQGLGLLDADRDGVQDLAVSRTSVSTITILRGNGLGGFSALPTTFTVGTDPEGLVIADFDGDGSADIATANYGGDSVSILLGNGRGGFTSDGGPVSVGSQPFSITAADFNGDGVPDLATANNASNSVSVLTGNGTGGFSSVVGGSLTTGSSPTSVVVGDFNGDGKPDLATANSFGNTVTVFLGNGAGGFTSALTGGFGVPSSVPFALAAADFSGDGRADLAVAAYGSNEVTILEGDQAPTVAFLGTTAGSSVPYGTPVPLTLSVALNNSVGFSSPSGSVSFLEGSAVLRTLQMSGGFQATSISGLARGSHTFSAQFAGGADFAASASNSVTVNVGQGIATVALGGLAAAYTGSPVSVNVTTSPANLSTSVTYDGSSTAPTTPGPYTVVATVTDPNYNAATVSGTLVISGATITLQANVAGVPITVDGGVPQISTWSGVLAPGAHSVSVPALVAGAAGTRYTFGHWSDSGAATHSITVGATSTAYTATYGTEFLLTTSAGAGGSVTAGGYFPEGSSVTVTATPASGFAFAGFTGAVTTSGNPMSVVLDAPKALQASFAPAGTPLLTASVIARADGVLPNERVWTVQVGNGGSGAALNARITGVQVLAANPSGNLGLILPGSTVYPVLLSQPALSPGQTGTATIRLIFPTTSPATRIQIRFTLAADNGYSNSITLSNQVR